jgi:hypothetical protein
LPREQAEFDLCLIEPTSVFRRVVHAEPIPEIPALPFCSPKRSVNDLRQCILRLSMTR